MADTEKKRALPTPDPWAQCAVKQTIARCCRTLAQQYAIEAHRKLRLADELRKQAG